ncbi:TIGR02530 family flagellar biosynthesis protein [Bdellovibrionota bacterium FG-1]
MSNGTFLYPNVTSLPAQSGVSPSERQAKKQEGAKGEFDQVFEQAIDKAGKTAGPAESSASSLEQIKAPLKFSAHASQRLRDRKINLDAATLTKVSEAVDKAGAKGIDDTLVLTKDAALIVNVKNRTVITAMDRAQMAGNVFTNIDGAVII